MLSALFGLLLFLGTLPDTTAVPAPEPRVNASFRFFPTSLYSDSQGFGVGLGLDVAHLLRRGSLLQLTARPAQHRGIYSAAFYTADPYEASSYGLVAATYTTTGVQRYYGLGPGSVKEAKISVEREWIEGEARYGWNLFGRRLLVQPNIRLLHGVGHGFREQTSGAISALDSASFTNLNFATQGEARRLTGGSAGIDFSIEGRDNPENAYRGYLVTLSARRFASLDQEGILFDQASIGAYRFIPISGRSSTLSLRALMTTTQNRTANPTPFFLLPTLDRELFPGFSRNRFYGNDVLMLNAEYRQYLFTSPRLGRIEATGSMGVGNIYSDIFQQFRPAVSFSRDLQNNAENYPMRAGFSIGGRIVSPRSGNVRLHGVVGFSAEGFSLVSFRFVQDIRRVRSPIR